MSSLMYDDVMMMSWPALAEPGGCVVMLVLVEFAR